MCLLHVICQKYTCNELNVKIYNIQTDNLICFQLFFSLPNEVRDVLVFLVGFPSFFLSFILSFFFFFTPTMALSKENPQIFNAISLLTFMGLQTWSRVINTYKFYLVAVKIWSRSHSKMWKFFWLQSHPIQANSKMNNICFCYQFTVMGYFLAFYNRKLIHWYSAIFSKTNCYVNMLVTWIKT
jgi:hypothetical protein